MPLKTALCRDQYVTKRGYFEGWFFTFCEQYLDPRLLTKCSKPWIGTDNDALCEWLAVDAASGSTVVIDVGDQDEDDRKVDGVTDQDAHDDDEDDGYGPVTD